MNQNFICENCKMLIDNETCQRCGKIQIDEKEKNIFDFSTIIKNKQKLTKINTLNENIDKFGYNEGLSKIFEMYPSMKNEFNDEEIFQSGDGFFHCYQEDRQKCLEIGSKLGNITETLSHNFTKVFSLDSYKENLEFQHKRFQHTKRKNIVLVKSEYNKLPFPDNYFDFIVCNELLKKISFMENRSKENQMIWLKEIKRVLKNDGFFYFTIHNKNGFELLNSKKNNLNRKKEKIGENQSYREYSKVLEGLGFKFKIYWALPSLNIPLYSGRLDDKKSISWFFKNLDKFLPKTKQISKKKRLFISFLKYSNSKLLKYIISKYTPSYHFCCTANGTFKDTIEEEILNKTKSKTFLTLSRRLKIIYFIFNNKNEPTKIAIVRKFSFNSLNDISYYKIRKYKGIFKEDKKVTYEDWKPGRMLDPTNEKEIFAALEWIFNFQNETKNEKMNESDIEYEIDEIEKEMKDYFPNDLFYNKWIKEYENYLKRNTIFKTSLHNDLSFRNFLIDIQSNQVNAIDWERYKKEGNPINDFTMYAFRTFVFKKEDTLEVFRQKIQRKNNEFNLIIDKVQKKFFEHYGFEMELLILIQFHLLRTITIKGKKGHNIEKELKMIELLKNGF